jgi:hypothetical protein
LVFFQRAWEVVLYEDIALSGESVEDLDAFWGLEGEAEGFLVAVYLEE